MALRPDDGFVDTRRYRTSWRLTFRFDGQRVDLADAEEVAMISPGAPMPPAGGTEASGSWVDLVDKGGRVLFRRVLNDPFSTIAEHHSPDGHIEVVRRPPEPGEFEVIVPAMPDGSEVAMWSSPLGPKRALDAARPLGRFRLSDKRRLDDDEQSPRPKKRP